MRGSWRANRNPAEPKPEPGRPRCPKWLDSHAKATWKHVVPLLERMGVLTRIDRNALVRYCVLWARWRKAEEFLRDHGETHVVKDAQGQVKGLRPYPQVRMANQIAEQLLRLEQQFGMTPSSRTRIEVPQQESQDDRDKQRYLKIS
ncbi:MAG: phage terminase small subunit P27 family [Planctomycetota bacterium]|jgi:P27 family predicted phage terminase small subunit